MYTYNQLIFPSNIEKDTRFFAMAGFSLNGPVGTPFIIRDGVDPLDILGDCRLTDNYRMAKEYGITPLIMRLNGSHGECNVIHDEKNVTALHFKTVEATDESNNIHIHLFPDYMIIEGINNNFSYLFSDYTSLDELVIAIKQELYFGAGEVDVEIVNQVPLTGFCTEEKYVQMDGADDGYNYVTNHDDTDTEDKLATQLELLRESLLDEESSEIYYTGEFSSFLIDTLLFTDIPFEYSPIELPQILGKFAMSKTDEQTLHCSVVLCSDYFSNSRFDEDGTDTFNEPIQTLLNNSPITIEETHYLQHIEVVVGTQDSGSNLSMPCAASYACMRYKLPDFYTSATNKAIPSITSTYNTELKQKEVANLSTSGYICIVPSIKKGFVPFSSKNLYPQNSFYSKPHFLRSIHYDVKKITSYFEPYIGEPFSYIQLQTIVTQIKNNLDDLLKNHPMYKNINLEILEYDESFFSLNISFELYGEIEAVRTSFQYTSNGEVNISWQ